MLPRGAGWLLLLAALLLAGCSGGGLASGGSVAVPEDGAGPSFIDPTADIQGRLEIGREVYIGPFATVNAGASTVQVLDHSDLQDNTLVDADLGRPVFIGHKVIVAHGASVVGPAQVGDAGGKPAFVGFNAMVDGAVVQPDAMVQALSRVGPGVTLRAGFKVRPGRNVTTQQQADNVALGFVERVTPTDRKFMADVIHVNDDLARGYALMESDDPASVRGIGPNPVTELNPTRDLPLLGGEPTAVPGFRNRIIGDLVLEDFLALLDPKMGVRDSLRADEGRGFSFGTLRQIADEVTFHALEHTLIRIGANGSFGRHAVIHGGADDGNSPTRETALGSDVWVGDEAVVFRSTVGDGCMIGHKALVDGCQLAPGTVVPDRAIMIRNRLEGFIDW